MVHTFYINSSADRHLGWLHILAITIRDAERTEEQMWEDLWECLQRVPCISTQNGTQCSRRLTHWLLVSSSSHPSFGCSFPVSSPVLLNLHAWSVQTRHWENRVCHTAVMSLARSLGPSCLLTVCLWYVRKGLTQSRPGSNSLDSSGCPATREPPTSATQVLGWRMRHHTWNTSSTLWG